MARDLPSFYTVEEAAIRALRSIWTIHRWLRSGYLPYVDGPGHPKRTAGNRHYVILGADLDVAVRRAQGLTPMEPGDRRVAVTPAVARDRKRTLEWLASRTPEQLAALAERNRANRRHHYHRHKRLAGLKPEPYPGMIPPRRRRVRL